MLIYVRTRGTSWSKPLSHQKMKTLLIDNGSKHTLELIKLLAENNLDIDIQAYNNLDANLDKYDLFILSGSSHTVNGNRERFTIESDLILNSTKPIIGICFGFQLIASRYGSKIEKLESKEEGVRTIRVTMDDEIFGGKNQFDAYVAHRFKVSKVMDPLIELASSDIGVEILKHKTKPIYGFQFHPEIATTENLPFIRKLVSKFQLD